MFNLSIFGGSNLGKRPWRPGRKLWSITLLGGTEIDFQQAQMEDGVTEMVCITLLGGADIIVPPEMPVTLSGFSLLGGREMKLTEGGGGGLSSDKSLEVRAFAVLGGISIKPPKGYKR